MPKVTYSASRGIVQSNGSGFIVNDVPITRSIANSGTAYASANDGETLTDTEEVILINLDASFAVASIADGGSIGEQRIIVFTDQAGAQSFEITDDGNSGTLTFTTPAAGSASLLIWTGSAWVVAS